MLFGGRRKINHILLAAIYAQVMLVPGCRQVDIARSLGIPKSNVHRKLPVLEKQGFLLAEDNGRLYPYRILSYNT